MDISKAFDTIIHQLLVGKLNAYGFSKEALNLVFSYLNNRKQRVKINKNFNSWNELLWGVPQGSVLGLIFKYVFKQFIFIFKQIDVCNFAHHTTPFVCRKNFEE